MNITTPEASVEWAAESASLGEILAGHQHAEIETVGGHPVALLSDRVRIESLQPLLDSYLPRPARARGFDELGDQESFIAHVLRHRQDHSVIFATIGADWSKFTAVYDYHDAGTAGLVGTPRHGEHGATFPVAVAREFHAWSDCAKRGFVGAAEFAEFLESHITDVVAAPMESPALAEIQGLLGGSWATPVRLIEVSRGLQVNIAEVVKNAASLSSGEIQITYDIQHRDSAGAPLRVPSLFAVGIPVIAGGARYQVAMRLRYRVREGRVTWAIAPHRLDAAWDHAIDELISAIKQATDLPVFRGSASGPDL